MTPLIMGEYFVTYVDKTVEPGSISYQVEYLALNEESKLEKAFTLNPYLQLNPRMGNVAEPDTKHFLHKDIYTHITYAELEKTFR